MKMLTALIAVLTVSSAFATSMNPGIPHEVYTCTGPSLRPGGFQPVGAAKLEIHEYYVKVGRMLPAFRSVYVLQVRPMNPTVAARTFELEYVNAETPTYHIYDALLENGKKSTYTVEHDLDKKVFTVLAGGAMKYTCVAERR